MTMDDSDTLCVRRYSDIDKTHLEGKTHQVRSLSSLGQSDVLTLKARTEADSNFRKGIRRETGTLPVRETPPLDEITSPQKEKSEKKKTLGLRNRRKDGSNAGISKLSKDLADGSSLADVVDTPSDTPHQMTPKAAIQDDDNNPTPTKISSRVKRMMSPRKSDSKGPLEIKSEKERSSKDLSSAVSSNVGLLKILSPKSSKRGAYEENLILVTFDSGLLSYRCYKEFESIGKKRGYSVFKRENSRYVLVVRAESYENSSSSSSAPENSIIDGPFHIEIDISFCEGKTKVAMKRIKDKADKSSKLERNIVQDFAINYFQEFKKSSEKAVLGSECVLP